MLPLVRLLDGQGTVVIRSSEATDGVGHDARDLTRKSAEDAGTSLSCDACDRSDSALQRERLRVDAVVAAQVGGCRGEPKRPPPRLRQRLAVALREVDDEVRGPRVGKVVAPRADYDAGLP